MKLDVQKIANQIKELFYSKKFLIYLFLNTVMVWGFIIFLFSREKELHVVFLFLFLSWVIIIIQYTPIKNAKTWIRKILYYLISMLSFLFLIGMLFGMFSDPSNFLKGGLFMAVVGSWISIISVPVFPSFVLINWLFRKETGIG
ncbi:hypothetical protein PGH07_09050 [Sulfurovum sp. zt1-1]|uniref:Uncharacterized protein n=1 Tax=Sulfurovum zhangzhouensis TaxID=3019067 RepID=A0ABT7QZQ5_9BACT|nr:hypothetical protein [Sulfurovum zhangzhouensis]MDM5272328.1 hypothetical protein [Sulfurovum zhangzhouensis]